MQRPLVPLPLPPGVPTAADLARAVTAVAAALDGSGPALAPVTAGSGLPGDLGDLADLDGVPPDVALVVPTSGSTGRPRHVLLDGAALLASAAATHARLAGPGSWVLALPLDHVAGLQVLVRSAVAGTVPVPADPRDVVAIASAAAALPTAGRARYTSLVPTQLHRLLAAADAGGPLPRALTPLTELDAVLVGGAAAGPELVERARALGIRVVTTYGMTETCGGCVYDGVPLDGVRVAVRDGVVELAGPVLARGYAGHESGFTVRDGERWFATADLGSWDGERLTVHGRRDDVLVVGGVNVAPAAVEAALAGLVAEACVVGLPDERWGQVPVAVVVAGAGGPPTLEAVRDVIGRTLGSAAAPRRLVVVDALPLRGPGKVDRAAVARLVTGA